MFWSVLLYGLGVLPFLNIVDHLDALEINIHMELHTHRLMHMHILVYVDSIMSRYIRENYAKSYAMHFTLPCHTVMV